MNLGIPRDVPLGAEFGVEFFKRPASPGLHVRQSATDALDNRAILLKNGAALLVEGSQGIAQHIVFGAVIANSHLLLKQLSKLRRALLWHNWRRKETWTPCDWLCHGMIKGCGARASGPTTFEQEINP
ncbi:MAG: hypothetical protein WD847_04085 [Pirellulales bacterium]